MTKRCIPCLATTDEQLCCSDSSSPNKCRVATGKSLTSYAALFIRARFIVLTLLVVSTATADEGMWLFDDLPVDVLKARYGFEPPRDWARHVMLSSVRFNSEGSASFVSSSGLVLTYLHRHGTRILAR